MHVFLIFKLPFNQRHPMQIIKAHTNWEPSKKSQLMPWFSRSFQLAFATACAAIGVLAGCGGSTNTVSQDNLRITADNALAVAKATNYFFDLFELIEFANEFIEGRSLAWLGTGQTRQCVSGDDTSGTWKVTAPGVGAVPLAGDKLTVEYTNCLQDPALPDRLTGTMAIALKTVVGNPATFAPMTAWSYTGDLSFVQFEIKNSERHHLIDGTLSFNVGARGLAAVPQQDISDLKITTARILVQKDADVQEFTNANLAILQDATVDPPRFQARVSASVKSTELGGKVDVQTVDLLTGSGITEYPNAGYSRILGGSGTSMDVRLGANTSVALQINTLGQAAQTINSTWSEIDHD